MQRDVLVYPAQGEALLDGIVYPADGSSPHSVTKEKQEQDVIRWVWQNRKRAGATTETFAKAKRLYLAIRIGQQVYGVIGIPMEKQTQPDAFTSSILSRRVRSGTGKSAQRRRKGKSCRSCKERTASRQPPALHFPRFTNAADLHFR